MASAASFPVGSTRRRHGGHPPEAREPTLPKAPAEIPRAQWPSTRSTLLEESKAVEVRCASGQDAPALHVDFWAEPMGDLLAAALGALGGAILAYSVAVRNIHHSAVVQERKAWRDTVRHLTEQLALALEANDHPKIRHLRRQMRMRLNPGDEHDNGILAADNVDELTRRVAVLLKDDWERVKLEASLLGYLKDRPPRPVVNSGENNGKVVLSYKRPAWKPAATRTWFRLLITARGFFWTILILLIPFYVRDVVLPLAAKWFEPFCDLWQYLKQFAP